MNEKRTVRIRTKAGTLIERRAKLFDKIDGEGWQSSIVIYHNQIFRFVEPDFYGPIYAHVQEGKR